MRKLRENEIKKNEIKIKKENCRARGKESA